MKDFAGKIAFITGTASGAGLGQQQKAATGVAKSRLLLQNFVEFRWTQAICSGRRLGTFVRRGFERMAERLPFEQFTRIWRVF